MEAFILWLSRLQCCSGKPDRVSFTCLSCDFHSAESAIYIAGLQSWRYSVQTNRYTTPIRTLQPQNDYRKARTQGELMAWSIHREPCVCVHACYLPEKWPTVCYYYYSIIIIVYGHPREGALDLSNGVVSEKTPHFLTFVAR